jgi:uncharacterized protein YbjQ (UPF0145 family)
MIISTTETIPSKEITEILGIARGSTVRARNVARDIFAGIKNLVGGEIEEYTKLQAQSREQALSRMIEDANRVGADAVVNVRFMTSVISQGAAEVLAYGTSVKTSAAPWEITDVINLTFTTASAPTLLASSIILDKACSLD